MLCPSQRLVYVRLAEHAAIVRSSSDARRKAEAIAEAPMRPGAAETSHRHAVAYWERYLLRTRGRRRR